MRGLLYIALLLIAPEIFAGVFDPPPTDKSVSLLGIIFGATVGDIALGGNANSVLAQMMEKFNFIIVVAGTVVVSYVAVLSTINTAQEGTAMGKKWSAVWIPMRSVAGMSLMVPAPASGYSMIQVTVMWIVIQGIGAADQLWNIALTGLTSGVSAMAGVTLPPDPSMTSTAGSLAIKALNAAICMQTIAQAAQNPINVAANNGQGNFESLRGQYVQPYKVQTISPTTSNNGASVVAPFSDKNVFNAKASGTFFIGSQNDPIANAQAICGQFNVTASVSSNEFPLATTRAADGSLQNDPQISADDVIQEAQTAYDTKMNAIGAMIDALTPLAKILVNNTATDPNQIPTIGGGQPNPAGYMAQAMNAYNGQIYQLVKPGSYNSSQATINTGVTNLAVDPDNVGSANVVDNSSSINAIAQAGIDNGWISAGSFYFVFNQSLVPQLLATATAPSDATDDQGTIPSLSCISSSSGSATNSCVQAAYNESMDPSDGLTSSLMATKVLTTLDQTALMQYLAYAYEYQTQDSSTGGGGNAFASASSSANPIAGFAGGANALMIQNLTSLMGSSGDPLMAHAMFGRALMITSETILSIMLIAAAVTSAFTGSFLGTGIGSGVTMITITFIAVIFGYLGTMWAFGALLAIYAPFIPFMIFDLTALGWMLTVVEAIIAAPIIALGLVMPSGDEMGKLEHALMLLANIFLRPTLMIFGFILAGGVYKAIINLIDFGMADVMQTIQVNTMFSSLAIVGVYVTFIISVTNQSFSLIYAVPDKILRWLGVGGESTNVSAVDNVKQAASSGNKAIAGEMSKQAGGAANALGQKGAMGAKETGGTDAKK